MPFTKEQLRAYWQINKEILNHKRRKKRRLAKLRLATAEVSHEIEKVSHLEISHSQSKEVANLKADNRLAQLIKAWQTGTNYNCAPNCNQARYCSNC